MHSGSGRTLVSKSLLQLTPINKSLHPSVTPCTFVRAVFPTKPSLELGVFVWDLSQITQVLWRVIFLWREWCGLGGSCEVFRTFQSFGSFFSSVSVWLFHLCSSSSASFEFQLCNISGTDSYEINKMAKICQAGAQASNCGPRMALPTRNKMSVSFSLSLPLAFYFEIILDLQKVKKQHREFLKCHPVLTNVNFLHNHNPIIATKKLILAQYSCYRPYPDFPSFSMDAPVLFQIQNPSLHLVAPAVRAPLCMTVRVFPWVSRPWYFRGAPVAFCKMCLCRAPSDFLLTWVSVHVLGKSLQKQECP